MSENENNNKNNKGSIIKIISIGMIIFGVFCIIWGITSIVNRATISTSTDFNFDNFEVIQKNSASTFISIFVKEAIGMTMVGFGVALLSASNFKTGGKHILNFSGNIIDSALNLHEQLEEKVKNYNKKKKIYCNYCGMEIEEDEKKCPNCGAIKSKDK